jgi:DNA replication protein DnaC
LLDALALARGDGRYVRLLKSLARVELPILDDWGLAPLTSQQGRDLLEIVDDRHGRGSTILTSQLPVDHWHEVIADAVLDRLVHTAHRLALDGETLRKPTEKSGKRSKMREAERRHRLLHGRRPVVVAAFRPTARTPSHGQRRVNH